VDPHGLVSVRNSGYTYRERIGPDADGMDLLAHLVSRYPHSSEREWRARIGEGRVRIDGAPGAPDVILRRGQRVVWVRPPWDEPAVPRVYAVLHEDASLLAVAKPSGLPTLPGAGFLENTLLSLVRQRVPEASPMHRLGRGTSGIVLFTRSSAAGRAVALAWRELRAIKIYRALVEGHPGEDSFEVTAPIGAVPHPGLGLVHAASDGGKPSRSWVRVLERRRGASLAEVTIETGRPHQIRIHMAACGHPLVGDPLYAPGGGFRDGGRALPGDTGYHLHAMRLAFPHPDSGEPFAVECAPPLVLRPGCAGAFC
jgi:23S rRNA pseudouridine1911/1915/1917 synthase